MKRDDVLSNLRELTATCRTLASRPTMNLVGYGQVILFSPETLNGWADVAMEAADWLSSHTTTLDDTLSDRSGADSK